MKRPLNLRQAFSVVSFPRVFVPMMSVFSMPSLSITRTCFDPSTSSLHR